MRGNINNVMTAIDYIESHLHEKLDLETVAGAVHFSKYHLHRMFTSTTGLTIHDYVQRRQLTEAAKLLVLSDKPILEIALSAGYESQQSFTDIFKAMYKKSPNQYRAEEEFYPLQLRYVLNEKPANLVEKEWQDKIVFATQEDIPSWMELVHLVIDGFPHLDEKQYLAQLQESVKSKRALILKDADTAIGIMAFNEITGSIDFFGVHPQYRKRGIAKAFCEKALYELARSAQISVTTFREGDKADTGYREVCILLLFTPASILQVLFQNLTVTAGRPGMGMVLGVSAGIANILLDYIFMVPLHMGIKGAAFGTGIGYMIPAVVGLWFFSAKRGSLYFRKPVIDFSVLAESCTNGFSEMVSQSAAAVTTFLFNRMMMKLLGVNGVAAITIMIYMQFLLSALYIGFSMGVAPVLSYNYGKQDEKQLKNVFSICMRFIVFVSVTVFAAALIFGSPVVGIFAEKGTSVYEIGRNGFLIFPFSFLFCGLNIFTSATFTALSNGKLSAILSFLRTFGLITVLLLTLPNILGVTGVWLAVPISELITMIVALVFLHQNREKYHYA